MTLKKKQEVETKGIGEIESEEGGKNPHSFWHQTLKFETKNRKTKGTGKGESEEKKKSTFFLYIRLYKEWRPAARRYLSVQYGF